VDTFANINAIPFGTSVGIVIVGNSVITHKTNPKIILIIASVIIFMN